MKRLLPLAALLLLAGCQAGHGPAPRPSPACFPERSGAAFPYDQRHLMKYTSVQLGYWDETGVRRCVEKAIGIVAEMIGPPPRPQRNVVIVFAPETGRGFTTPGWGYTEIRLPLNVFVDGNEATLIHEVVHAYFQDDGTRSAPYYIREGVPMALETIVRHYGRFGNRVQELAAHLAESGKFTREEIEAVVDDQPWNTLSPRDLNRKYEATAIYWLSQGMEVLYGHYRTRMTSPAWDTGLAEITPPAADTPANPGYARTPARHRTPEPARSSPAR